MENDDPAQNSTITAEGKKLPTEEDGKKLPGKPFEPGDGRINRNGRPKGIARMMRELAGDGEELVKAAFDIATGRLKLKRYTMLGEPYEVEPNYKERLQAAEFCRDTGWGRPAQTIELSGPDGEAIELKAQVSADVEPGAIEKVVEFATRLGLEAAAGAAAGIGEGACTEVDEIHSAQAAPNAAILPPTK